MRDATPSFTSNAELMRAAALRHLRPSPVAADVAVRAGSPTHTMNFTTAPRADDVNPPSWYKLPHYAGPAAMRATIGGSRALALTERRVPFLEDGGGAAGLPLESPARNTTLPSREGVHQHVSERRIAAALRAHLTEGDGEFLPARVAVHDDLLGEPVLLGATDLDRHRLTPARTSARAPSLGAVRAAAHTVVPSHVHHAAQEARGAAVALLRAADLINNHPLRTLQPLTVSARDEASERWSLGPLRPFTPLAWAPRSLSAAPSHVPEQVARDEGNSGKSLPRGARAFIVRVITDPRRWPVVHSSNSSEAALASAQGLPPTAESGEDARTVDVAMFAPLTLHGVAASSICDFAAVVCARVAAEAGLHLDMPAFRFTDLSESAPWRSARVVDVAPMFVTGVSARLDGVVATSSRTAAVADDAVARAATQAAAAAAGTVTISELPEFITVLPCVAPRRLAFTVTCIRRSAAAATRGGLADSDVLAERRGAGWIASLAQLRAALTRVTHIDCHSVPLFVAHRSPDVDPDAPMDDPAAPPSPVLVPLVTPYQLEGYSSIVATFPSHGPAVIRGPRRLQTPFALAAPSDAEAAGVLPAQAEEAPLDASTGAISAASRAPFLGGLFQPGHSRDVTRRSAVAPITTATLTGATFGGNVTDTVATTTATTASRAVPGRLGLRLSDAAKWEGTTRFGTFAGNPTMASPARRHVEDISGLLAPRSQATDFDDMEEEVGAPDEDHDERAAAMAGRNVLRTPTATTAGVRLPMSSALTAGAAIPVTRTRYRRALLQLALRQGMRLSQMARDAKATRSVPIGPRRLGLGALSVEELVHATSDATDLTMRELEGPPSGIGTVIEYRLPLTTAAVRALHRHVAEVLGVAAGAVAATGESVQLFHDSYVSDPKDFNAFTTDFDSMESAMMPMTAHGDDFLAASRAQNKQQSREDASGHREGKALNDDSVIAAAWLRQRQVAEAGRGPISDAQLILSRPQFDAAGGRVTFFATCGVDFLSTATAATSADGFVFPNVTVSGAAPTTVPEPLHGAAASGAAYHRWVLAHGHVTQDAMRRYLAAKQRRRVSGGSGSNNGGGIVDVEGVPVCEVPLDALIALGVARADIVKYARPSTLSLEIHLRRPHGESNATDGDRGGNDATTTDILQPDGRYTMYVEVGDGAGGSVGQAVTFILPKSLVRPQEYMREQMRRAALHASGPSVRPVFDEFPIR